MQLEKTTIIPEDIKKIAALFTNDSKEIFMVGGCVRDLLLDIEPHDWDLCTNATPEEIKKIAKDNGIFTTNVGEQFGTIVLHLNGQEYEVTTYRTDGIYTDNRRPESIEYAKTIEDDLSRRDFTINAIAVNPITNEIIDPFHGIDDLSEKILRTVGYPENRFNEDALRMMRAIRFSTKYEMEMSQTVVDAIHKLVNNLDTISKERITDELLKTFSTGKPISDMFIEFSDVMSVIVPEIKPCIGFNQNNKYHKHDVYEHTLAVVDGCKTQDPIIKMAALLHDIGKPDSYVIDEEGHGHFYGHPEVSYEMSKSILRNNFRLTTEQMDRIEILVRNHDMTLSETRKSVKKALNKMGYENLKDWFILKQADFDDHIYPNGKLKSFWTDLTKISNICDKIINEQQCFSLNNLAINGKDIMNLFNMKPNKDIGIILNGLLNAVIDEKIENTFEDLSLEAKQIYEAIQLMKSIKESEIDEEQKGIIEALYDMEDFNNLSEKEQKQMINKIIKDNDKKLYQYEYQVSYEDGKLSIESEDYMISKSDNNENNGWIIEDKHSKENNLLEQDNQDKEEQDICE